MNRHLIVVSVDAMVYEDLELLKQLPHTGKLMADGSLVRRVKTIYPSLTHPVHATLITGCPPRVTGIVNNERFVPFLARAPWFNDLGQIQCDTLFHAAHRAGLTTCACRWPVTAGGFDVIDYLVPEVLDVELRAESNLEKLYRRVCTDVLFESVIQPHLSKLEGSKHPNDEHFSIACACDIIRQYKPNLLMTHPAMVDSVRHRNGLFGEPVNDGLRLTDHRIGQLMQAVADAEMTEETSFCIVSDHGQLEIRRALALNVFFCKRGWIETNEDGGIANWRVYAHSAGLSAQIYVKEKADENAVYKMLQEMCDEGIYGISEVLTRQEAEKRYGLSGEFSFVVESDGFTSFHSDWRAPAVRPVEISDYRYGRATHGHMPEKGPQPPMIVSGSAFQQNVVLDSASILDEAPTFAAALGISLPQAEGRVLWELLKKVK